MTEPQTTPIRARLAGLRATALALPLAFGLAAPGPAAAQSPFAPVARINDSVVTAWEVDQRALFLEVVRTPGDLRAEALEQLINERLQVQEARRLGVAASPEEIETGVAEFAARADLGAEQFLEAIGAEGVAPETFRDFVANGISWRNVVQERFSAQARAAATEAAVDAALAHAPRLDGAQILLAEIVIPLVPENQDTLREALAEAAADLNGDIDGFSETAARFSAAPTREDGGVTGWRPLDTVPPPLREDLVLLAPGETYGPVPLGPAIAIFQMRGLSEGAYRSPPVVSTDYATIALPAIATPEGAAAAAQLRADVDVCDDLYGRRPAGSFDRFDQALADIPGDIAMALATLDPGEISFTVARDGGASTLAVMLCARSLETPEAGREAVRQQLFGEALQRHADALLEELRADAIISTE